ncbi:flagellar export chaperone FliS [Gammaproteobacteria bacterium 42_54_T18]|nr:flagellar export chaperone FliS [Gammaproteobacteria bacterium 42_54_T18]
MYTNKAANQYAAVNKQTGVEGANPHQLIQMLYEGAIENMARAKGCMERKDFSGKGDTLGRAINIIGGLQSFLDKEKGGEVAENLDALYDYMSRRLFEASKDNDIAIIDEVIGLVRVVKTGWEGIKDEASKIFETSS